MKMFNLTDIQKNKIKIAFDTLFFTLFGLLFLAFIFNINLNIFKNNKYDTSIYGYDKVSTAIDERGELLIINRSDGTYKIYSDSVCNGIFNLKANKIYKDMQGK